MLLPTVVKMKFKDTKRRLAVGRKVNAVYKTWRGTPNELRKLRKPRLRLREADQCCTGWLSSQPNRQRYLVMGKKEGNRLIPTFIHPWKKSNEVSLSRKNSSQYIYNLVSATLLPKT